MWKNHRTLEPEPELPQTDYVCKICQKPGRARFGQCDEDQFNSFHKLLTCNRCYDFELSMGKIRSEMHRTCTQLIIGRETAHLSKTNAEASNFTEKQSRRTIDALTRRLTLLVAKRYSLMDQWADDFPLMIVERPDAAMKLIRMFVESQREEGRKVLL